MAKKSGPPDYTKRPDSRTKRPNFDDQGEGDGKADKTPPWDDIPTIDKPPRGEPVDQPTSRMLIPLVTGDMSERQEENQRKGANRALSKYKSLEEQLPAITEMLDSASNEGAITAINKMMLVETLNLLPTAFDRYASTGMDFNAYALAALVNQTRALITDVQASKDRSLITDRVLQTMRNAMMLIIQHAADQSTITKSTLAGKIKPEYEKNVIIDIDNSLRALSRYMKEVYDDVTEKISALLTE